jgi:hypothetical protein
MPSPAQGASVLVVNGFHRLSRSLNPRQTTPISGGGSPVTFERVRPRYSNSFDYVVQAGESIEAYSVPLGFDSCDSLATVNGDVSLSDYDAVIWLAGEESTADETFSSAEQSAVAAFVAGGGRLFVSGAEIAWDLVAQGTASDTTFYQNTLKASYAGDDANSYSAVGTAGSIFEGISLSFDNGTQFYNVDFPDRLSALGGSTVTMTYVGGTGDGAAIQWSGPETARVVNFGFPFETISTAANRNAVMAAVLNFFEVAAPTPAPSRPDLADGSDTGVSSSDDITRRNNTPGETLQFTVGGTVSGATVTIFANGNPIGSAVASGSSTVVTTDSTFTLTDGPHAITATQTISGGPPSVDSPSLSITIDTEGPTVESSEFAFQTGQALSFVFSESVIASVTVDELVLQNITSSTTVPAGAMAVSFGGGGTTATFTFPGFAGSILPDGNYRAMFAAAATTDVAGNALGADHLFDFFVLAGDANRDRIVDITDLGILASNWQQSPRTFADADFNYDGTVDITDLGILATNWQSTLPAPPPPRPVIVASAGVSRPAGLAHLTGLASPLVRRRAGDILLSEIDS